MAKRKKYDSLPVGMLVGLVAPFAGFLIYGWFWSMYYHRSMKYFIEQVFLGMPQNQSPIITLSLIINLLPFFIFLRLKRYRTAQGVVAALFLYVPVVLYLKFG